MRQALHIATPAGAPPRLARFGRAAGSFKGVGTGRQKAATAATDEKRERILKAAERLFHEQGYADTTIGQIVQTLGVTKPYVYYYFHNKQEIFERLSWRPTVACFTALDLPPGDRRPAHQKITGGLERLIRATIDYYPSAFFAYRDPQVFRPEFAAAQKKIAHHFYARLCDLMDEARRDGTLDFSETKITALAACSLPGFLYTWYRPDGRLPPEAMVRELARLAWRVIGLRGVPPLDSSSLDSSSPPLLEPP